VLKIIEHFAAAVVAAVQGECPSMADEAFSGRSVVVIVSV
jgi:hypothetical protein